MEQVSLEETRIALGDIVNRAALAGEAWTITRYGKPAAVIIGYDAYQEMRARLDRGQGDEPE